MGMRYIISSQSVVGSGKWYLYCNMDHVVGIEMSMDELPIIVYDHCVREVDVSNFN